MPAGAAGRPAAGRQSPAAAPALQRPPGGRPRGRLGAGRRLRRRSGRRRGIGWCGSRNERSGEPRLRRRLRGRGRPGGVRTGPRGGGSAWAAGAVADGWAGGRGRATGRRRRADRRCAPSGTVAGGRPGRRGCLRAGRGRAGAAGWPSAAAFRSGRPSRSRQDCRLHRCGGGSRTGTAGRLGARAVRCGWPVQRTRHSGPAEPAAEWAGRRRAEDGSVPAAAGRVRRAGRVGPAALGALAGPAAHRPRRRPAYAPRRGPGGGQSCCSRGCRSRRLPFCAPLARRSGRRSRPAGRWPRSPSLTVILLDLRRLGGATSSSDPACLLAVGSARCLDAAGAARRVRSRLQLSRDSAR